MKSPFEFSSDNKRYHTLSCYNRRTFGCRVYKAVLDCGFTCPNIDGSRGTGGCIFCDGGSGYFTNGGLSVLQQLSLERDRIFRKSGEVPIIAYFQANTNTYASAERLSELYDEALLFNGLHGISIGTRADCLPDDVLDLLTELSHRTHLTIELGMQSSKEQTLASINRCCTHREFLEGYFRLKKRGIRVCLHIINGLLGENAEDMLATARELARMKPDAVKIQMLHVIRGTRLGNMYEAEPFPLLSREEYVDTVVRQLELLPAETVIERITGDGDKKKLIAPSWSADKLAVLGAIDKRLAELDTWQGKLYGKHGDQEHTESFLVETSSESKNN